MTRTELIRLVEQLKREARRATGKERKAELRDAIEHFKAIVVGR